MLKSIIGAIVAGLIIWFVQNHLKDVPTVTYSISDSIEIPGSLGAVEYAQEIALLNSGQSPVKSISIKVPRHISSYKLTKHSNLLKEEVVSSGSNFELVYPELPKGQKVRLLVRYDSSPIEKKDWISISHADGHAQPQENKSPEFNYAWIWLAFFMGMLWQGLGDLKRWKREGFRKWTSNEEIFRNDKPWFASSGEWSEMQFEAIARTLTDYDFNFDEQTSYYKLLNRSKPTLLSEEHWIVLQKKAIKLLIARFSSEVTRYSTTEKLIDFLKLKKPEALPQQSWAEFQDSLREKIQTKLIPLNANAANFIGILDSSNSSVKGLPSSIYDEIYDLAQQRYYDYLVNGSKFEIRDNPSFVLATARFDLLTTKQAESVKEIISRFARMREMPSRWQVIELEEFSSKNRPEWMPESEFNAIREFVAKANALSDDRYALEERQKALTIAAEKTEGMKRRVIAQLDLIDKVLTNPKSIEKIEDYDQTFAPGNRKNLELIAVLLCSAQTPIQQSPCI
jgi:hypothetical protein